MIISKTMSDSLLSLLFFALPSSCLRKVCWMSKSKNLGSGDRLKAVLDRGVHIIWERFGMNRVKWVIGIESAFQDPVSKWFWFITFKYIYWFCLLFSCLCLQSGGPPRYSEILGFFQVSKRKAVWRGRISGEMLWGWFREWGQEWGNVRWEKSGL